MRKTDKKRKDQHRGSRPDTKKKRRRVVPDLLKRRPELLKEDGAGLVFAPNPIRRMDPDPEAEDE